MDAAAAADALERELRRLGNPERAANEKRYLKSELEFVGASVPAIAGVAKRFMRERPGIAVDELLAIAETLWAKPIHERRMLVVELLELNVARLEEGHLPFIERLLRESGTWALVDGLAASVVGRMLLDRPRIAATLDRWALDPDFWIRRSALLAHLERLRRGGALDDFARYADIMLDEREFFIRKAIGWVLREAGRRRPGEVAAWLAVRTDRASGVTMREAVKYLPPDRAQRLMRAFRGSRPVRR